jgi:hypothetical protein
MTGIFLMSLSLLKFGVLGCVEKGAALLVRQLGEKSAGVFFSPVFLGLMSHLLQAGALKWSHQMAVL